MLLTADTIVWHRGRILNKPADAADACAMLRMLRGHRHEVFSGICVRCGPDGREYHVEHDTTTVRFCDVSDHWIDSYVATGEPMDKAGSYAAQGLSAVIIEGIEGDFSNVVGLPLGRLGRLLARVGAPVELWWSGDSGDSGDRE